MKNIIVVGDSFCTYYGITSWPYTLAKELNLNLICHGVAGQPWWNARNFLKNLSQDVIDATEIIVFAHTFAERLPTLNEHIGRINHHKPPELEIETAIQLYYKYIHEHDFLTWAQEQWFLEITRTWGHKKLCHLHCFPWSVPASKNLTGLNVTTNLTAISLNELGSTEFNLFDDGRSNHLSTSNNKQLGLQLADQFKNYGNKNVELDITKFEQLTTVWLDKGLNWS